MYIAIDEFQQIMEYPEKGVEGLLRSYGNSYSWHVQAIDVNARFQRVNGEQN